MMFLVRVNVWDLQKYSGHKCHSSALQAVRKCPLLFNFFILIERDSTVNPFISFLTSCVVSLTSQLLVFQVEEG